MDACARATLFSSRLEIRPHLWDNLNLLSEFFEAGEVSSACNLCWISSSLSNEIFIALLSCTNTSPFRLGLTTVLSSNSVSLAASHILTSRSLLSLNSFSKQSRILLFIQFQLRFSTSFGQKRWRCSLFPKTPLLQKGQALSTAMFILIPCAGLSSLFIFQMSSLSSLFYTWIESMHWLSHL